MRFAPGAPGGCAWGVTDRRGASVNDCLRYRARYEVSAALDARNRPRILDARPRTISLPREARRFVQLTAHVRSEEFA